jgi:hypothetical protein
LWPGDREPRYNAVFIGSSSYAISHTPRDASVAVGS